MLRFRARDDFGSRIDPFAKQLSARIARRDSYLGIVADALRFAGIRGTVNVELLGHALLRLSGKPHWSAHALAILAKRFQIDVLLSLQGGKSRVGHNLYRWCHSSARTRKWTSNFAVPRAVLPRGRRYAGWGRAITLRGIADDDSD